MTGKLPLNKPTTSFPKPLNVAIVVDAWFPSGKNRKGVWGGGQVHVKELTMALKNQFQINSTIFYPTNPHILYRLLWTPVGVIKIILAHQSKHFNLIHSHGYNAGLVAKISSVILKIPVVHTVHGSSLLDTKATGFKANLENWLLTKIKYNHQITVAQTFTKHSNVNKITVIRNGVDVTEFDKVEIEKDSDPTIIWIGRDDPIKGLSILKEAVVKVRKVIPNLKVNLVSDGRLYGKSLIKAYKRAHLFVLPSLAEGQPITLLEAWAAKLAVVVTAVGDNPLMVVDGVNGLLVDPGSVNQLKDAIIKFFNSRSKKITMGEKGYNLVKSEYSWSQVAKKTYEVYKKVLNY